VKWLKVWQPAFVLAKFRGSLADISWLDVAHFTDHPRADQSFNIQEVTKCLAYPLYRPNNVVVTWWVFATSKSIQLGRLQAG